MKAKAQGETAARGHDQKHRLAKWQQRERRERRLEMAGESDEGRRRAKKHDEGQKLQGATRDENYKGQRETTGTQAGTGETTGDAETRRQRR